MKFPEKLHEGGRQEGATCRHVASKNVESACSGDGSYEKIEIEEPDDSCCGQKEQDLPFFVYGRIWLGSRGKSSLPWLLSFGQKEFGLENGVTS